MILFLYNSVREIKWNIIVNVIQLNWLIFAIVNPRHFWLKCLYQARKVSIHVYLCEGYRFYFSMDFRLDFGTSLAFWYLFFIVFTWLHVLVFLFCVRRFEVKGICSFYWYWWNCWPSLFKPSFHKQFKLFNLWIYYQENKHTCIWKRSLKKWKIDKR